MIKINLLPVRAKSQLEALKAQGALAILMLLIVGGIAGYLYVSINDEITLVAGGITKTKGEITKLGNVKKKRDDFRKKKGGLEAKLEVIDKLNRGRTGHVYFLDEFSRVIPDKLWIDSLSEGGWNIKLSGSGLNHDVIAEFMTNMERSPQFKNVKLRSTRAESKAGLSLMRFNIGLSFDPNRPNRPKEK